MSLVFASFCLYYRQSAMAKGGRSRASPPSATRDLNLVPLSCPDCFGVLRFEREGPYGHLLYRCQVDHRYSVSSLLHAKESHLERTLWSVVLLLKQMTYAYDDLLGEMKRAPAADRRRVQRRLNEARKHCQTVQGMIEGAHAAR
ncbi:MAG TPA: hypothetical protein VFS39_17700 [Nitrospira sp.]|nr:hypothetical protein [Nitrospira sp.]